MLLALAFFAVTLRDAQQLLFSHRYTEAEQAYREILRQHPDNAEALKGLATAEYWSGDLRSARRDFGRLLTKRPNDAEARKAVADIDAASEPIATTNVDATTDDQPMRRTVASASYTMFSDPLTTWTAAAGTYFLAARSLGFVSATAPFASVGGSTTFPDQHLKAGATIRAIRFPDSHNQLLGGASLARVWPHASLTMSFDRHEILYTATSLGSHPYETALQLAWNRVTAASASNAAIRHVVYFDRNHGLAAEAYQLNRIAHGETWAVQAGAAASYRDTDESRFISGRYEPYWTPIELREARAILASDIGVRRAAIHLHVDGGVARDAQLARTFHPWRTSAAFDFPLGRTFRMNVAAERQSTVFYRANTIAIGISGRP